MNLMRRLTSSTLGRAAFLSLGLVPALLLYLKFTGRLASYLSPGPISAMVSRGVMLEGYQNHAEFEHECLHCHAPIHCLSADRCQQCHREVARQRAEADGLHGALPATDRCQVCHPEHRGREASLTRVPVMNVDHQKLSGFSLERHQVGFDGEPLECESCHGIEQFAVQHVDCIHCHEEADADFVAHHGERFGGACIVCHDGADRMLAFDHETVYVREGAHAQATCDDCHLDQRFAGTPRACVGCHAEPQLHAGQFGEDCARCHSAVAWVPARLLRHVFVIDHGHIGVPTCESCHTVSYTMYRCDGCHDPLKVELAHVQYESGTWDRCVDCHPTGAPGEGEMARDANVRQ